MILIDANIFMYAGGADHPHKQPSTELLRRVANRELEAAIDAEVLQEILHRYRTINRWEDGRLVYDFARRIVPTVLAVSAETLDAARALLDQHPSLTARDAVHASVCRLAQARGLCSYDRDFDVIEDFTRFEPGDPRF